MMVHVVLLAVLGMLATVDRAQTACDGAWDLVFVVDSSGSIRDNNPADGSYDNWDLLLAFLTNLVDNLDVGPDATRIGLVRYGNTGENIFYLNTYATKVQVKDAISRVEYIEGNTNTSGGLRVMHTQQFNSSRDRSNIPNVGIVITDGVSTFDSQFTIPYAEAARADGIQIMVVGITNAINEEELAGISSPPQTRDENYFTVADFAVLDQIVDQICPNGLEPTQPPQPTTQPTPQPTQCSCSCTCIIN